MKIARSIFVFLFLLSALLGLSSCSNDVPIDNSFITLSQKVVNFEAVGESVPITAQIFTSDENAVLEWTSSNPEVAVYENGEIRSVGYGTCIIRASYKNISAACTVYFENPYSTIVLSQTLFEFDSIGAVSSITAHTGDKDITGLVTWSTTNPDIASCNQNGVITTNGYGACIVIARLDSEISVASVIVRDPDEKKLTLSENEISINEGEEYILTADKNSSAGSLVTWISSNPEILECEGGVIKAKSAGIASVIAITERGASDVCKVTVGQLPEAPIIPADMLEFKMPDVPHAANTVDPETGEIVATATVTSYTVTPNLDKKTGRLYLIIQLHCVKTYDSFGMEGLTPMLIATNLYRENDFHCERKLYKIESMKVGEEFTINCSLFSVQTEPGVIRQFYMTLEDVCEN